MSRSRAEGYIDQAVRAGIRHIVFNGGEPFLHISEIASLIRYAGERRILSTVVTSGSWAVSRKRSLELLSELKRSGLYSLTLSTDRYHLTFVPQRHIINALTAARKLDIRVGVKIARLPWDPVADGLFRAVLPLTERVTVQEVSPMGRASTLRDSLLLRPVFHLNRPGCRTPPVLLPNGLLLTCCNLPARDMDPTSSPFFLGTLDRHPLEELMELRRRDPLLRFLRQQGPLGLYAPLLASAPENAPLPPSLFHDGCDLCFHLFRNGWARAAARDCVRTAKNLKRRGRTLPGPPRRRDGSIPSPGGEPGPTSPHPSQVRSV